jgi:prevent-host-death family protein
MDAMAISEFKAKCLATLERVRRTGRPLRITRFGKPVADIVPAGAEPARAPWLGCMRGTGEVVGDIITPVLDHAAWTVLKS